MKLFFIMILSTYITLWSQVDRIKWNEARIGDDIDINLSKLQRDSFFNRIIHFSLKKKNGECQYIYYVKRIIIIVAVLLIPWFIFAYLYEWYNIRSFIIGHLIIWVFVCSAPANIFNVIVAMYRRKSRKKG